MINFNYDALFSVTEMVREKYPKSILGFLGNSLSVCAVADKYFSDVNKSGNKQYMVPFSGKHVFSTKSVRHSQTIDFDLHKAYSADLKECPEYLSFIENSEISPSKIIENKQQLVIVDRIWHGDSLASFSHVWHTAAQKQGYTPQDVQEHFRLCAIKHEGINSVEKDFYRVIDPRQNKEICYTNVDWMNGISDDVIRDIIMADDYNLVPRLCPEKHLDSTLWDKEDYSNKIREFYDNIHANTKNSQANNFPSTQDISCGLSKLIIK